MSVAAGFVGSSPNADPSLNVSLSTVDDPAVRYVVWYSTTAGSMTVPPTGAEELMTNTANDTLHVMPPDKRSSSTYYIWAAAVTAGDRGEYSDRRSANTLNGEQHECTYCLS